MRKLTLVLSVTLLAFVAISVVIEEAKASHLFATARLKPVDHSGAHAVMILRETFRGDIKAVGFAVGLDPDAAFGHATLMYIGPTCAPIIPGNPPIPASLGVLDEWDVRSDGTARLSVKLKDPGFPLSDIVTVSIRRIDDPTTNPPTTTLLACGEVR